MLHFSAGTRIGATDAADNPETSSSVNLKLPRLLLFTFLVWFSVRLVASWRRRNGNENQGSPGLRSLGVSGIEVSGRRGYRQLGDVFFCQPPVPSVFTEVA